MIERKATQLAALWSVAVVVIWLYGAAATTFAADTDQPKGASAEADASNADRAPSAPERKYTTETIQGRVVWLEDALDRGFGVATEPAAAQTSVVVETADGQIWPVVPDTRGRAFAVDERLRGIDVRLLVRRYADAPLVQVIRVFRSSDEGLQEVDYWCDICAIPMYILKPCECCQGPTRLRERPAENVPPGL